jgi:hypothetical protein
MPANPQSTKPRHKQAPGVSLELVSFLDETFPDRVKRSHEDNLITLGTRKVVALLRRIAESQHHNVLETTRVPIRPQDPGPRPGSGPAATGAAAGT